MIPVVLMVVGSPLTVAGAAPALSVVNRRTVFPWLALAGTTVDDGDTGSHRRQQRSRKDLWSADLSRRRYRPYPRVLGDAPSGKPAIESHPALVRFFCGFRRPSDALFRIQASPLSPLVNQTLSEAATAPATNRQKPGFSREIAKAPRATAVQWHKLRPIFRRFEPPGLTVSPTTGGIVTG